MTEPKYDYFEDSIETENRDIEQKVVIPSKTTFKGRRWDGWDIDNRQGSIDRAERVIMTHTDADGYVSGALFKDYFKGNCEVITVDYEDIESTLEYILNEEEGELEDSNKKKVEELYVCDLNLDDIPETISPLVNKLSEFKWFDHHEWGEKEDALRNMGVDITIDTEECGASIVHKYITDNGYSSNDKVRETVELTKDHDLWKHEMSEISIGGKEVCISEVFSQMAFLSNTNVFINNILDYGKNFLDYEGKLLNSKNTDPVDKNYTMPGHVSNKIREGTNKVNYIINNETEIENIKGYTVAFAYGRGSPGNILEKLVDQEDIDILVHTKPSYPVKISFRSTENFNKCHEIAEEFGGGGHEQAAGCKPSRFEEPMEWFNYITQKGKPLEDDVYEYLEEYL